MEPHETSSNDGLSERESEAPSSSVLLRRVIPLTALVLAISLVGLILYSVVRPTDARGPAGVAINENGALVQLEPRPAADFRLAAFDGGQMRLSDFRGQVVVVNFWASWCPPCREEARDLERAWQELRDANVVFLGLNVWDDRDEALAFIDEFDVSYLNGVIDDGNPAVDFGVRGLPETFIINADGDIVAKFIGPVKAPALIETVQGVQASPTAARDRKHSHQAPKRGGAAALGLDGGHLSRGRRIGRALSLIRHPLSSLLPGEFGELNGNFVLFDF